MRPVGCRSFARAALAAASLTLMAAVRAAGQDSPPPTLHVPRIAEAPTLARVVEGIFPEGMAAVSDFRQRQPGDGDPASLPTTAHLGYDASNLYVVFVCKDDPHVVRARLARREAIVGDDIVFIALDTFRDKRRSYIFFANPLGIQMDGINTDGQGDDYSFDALWYSEGRVTRDGFVVVMSIPFRSLRFPDAPSQTWGLALLRIVARKNELAFWPRMTARIPSTGEQMATLTGLEDVSPGRNLQAIPYAASTTSRHLDEAVGRYGDANRARLGVDLKAVIKDAVTVDVTANPDFSQVEADEPQVTVNQRWEAFFPERRPFFVENAGMFRQPLELFFSRRIADPRAGVRVTGKARGWSLAALAIDDRAPGQRAPEGSDLHGQPAGVGVLRLQRDVGEKSTIGLFASMSDFGPSSNRVASADGRLQITPRLVLRAQTAWSSTTTSEGTGKQGGVSMASLDYDTRAFGWSAAYNDRAPGFSTAVGYLPRVDLRAVFLRGRYTWFPKSRHVLSLGPGVRAWRTHGRDGSLADWLVEPQFSIEMPASTTFKVLHSTSYERYRQVDLPQRLTTVSVSTSWFRRVSASLTLASGRSPNYYPAAGLAPFVANRFDCQPGVTLRPGSRLRIDATWIRTSLQAADEPEGTGVRTRIYSNTLARLKSNFQFTRRTSLRAILDYAVVAADAGLIALEGDRRLTGDVLFTWMLNPGTALHVGYTDRYANLAPPDADGVPMRRTSAPTLNTGRQLFAKVSYLLRY